MKTYSSSLSAALLFSFVAVLTWAPPVLSDELVSRQLVIRGANLTVGPSFQEVDPGRPTVVHTSLGEMTSGEVPAGLRVEGELSGPGLDEALHLSTLPGDDFQIPGLNREGAYTLSGIRLTENGLVTLEATPSSVEIFVHRLIIASISSRPLTREEMESYGIVISDDSYTAWHYTVGFQVGGEVVDIPFDVLIGPDGLKPLEMPNPYYLPIPENPDTDGPVPTVVFENLGAAGGGPEGDDDDIALEGVTVPGFLIFPTDIAFLNQFFSVIMVIQNGALEGSGLELRDLSAVLDLHEGGIRQAETEPPTIPGEAVPIMDPGPDGIVGTSDDLTFIIAQASGEASWLIEGLEEGQHYVTARVSGQLHGLAGGEPVPITGSIPGVVLVRDPRFSMTFFHPWTVRAGEDYDFKVVVANTSITPVYDLSMTLPGSALTGAQLADGTEATQSITELLPGGSAMVTWRLHSLTTGRVVASGFNTSNAIDASFRFEVGVGELGIPLSPESLVLPPIVDLLPDGLVESALELLGLAYSVATAPNGSELELPPIGEGIVRIRGAELATCARRIVHGESEERALMTLGLRWMGTSYWSTGFDALKRASSRGHEMEAHLATAIESSIENVGFDESFRDLEEVAITGNPTLLVYAEGAGYEGSGRLMIVGLDSGATSYGQRADAALFVRDLPGAAILEIDPGDASWAGEIGVVSLPVDEAGEWIESGYQIILHGTGSGDVELEAVIVMPNGSTRRISPDSTIPTNSGSMAFINVDAVSNETILHVDSNGDRIEDFTETLVVHEVEAPLPRVIAARFDSAVNPVKRGAYNNVILLFSQAVDLGVLSTIDVEQWLLTSHVELYTGDGSLVVSDRDRHGRLLAKQSDPAFLVLSCDAPLNPHADMFLSSNGADIPFLGGRSMSLIEEAISSTADLDSGLVRGVVIGDDGEVVPGARVDLYEYVFVGLKWILSLSDHVVADETGAFILDAVRYRSGGVPGRYSAFLIRAIDPQSGHEALARASLSGNGVARDLTVFMVGRGDVVGTVVRQDGAPLAEPKVYGRSVTNPEEYSVTEPDSSGFFRLTDLPVGGVQVLAVDGLDYTYGTAMIPGPGQEGRVDLVLPIVNQPLAQVVGTVTDGETTLPMSGAQVYLVPPGSEAATHLATTDSDGTFSMSDAPPGVATFKVWDPARNTWVANHLAELAGDTTNTVSIVTTTSASGSILGTVYRLVGGVRTPVEGAYVIAQSHGRWTMTDADGTYRLDDLLIGNVFLRAMDPVTGDSVSRSANLTVDGQELVIDLDLAATEGSGRIQVTVVNRAGIPEQGAMVAVSHFGSGQEGVTASDGTVLLEGLSPGSHNLVVQSFARLGRGNASVAFDGHTATATIVLGGVVGLSVETVAETTGGGSDRILSPITYRRPGVNAEGFVVLLPEEGEYTCETDENFLCEIDNLPEGVGPLIVTARNPFHGQVSHSEELDPSDDGKLITLNFSALGTLGGHIVTEVDGELVPVVGAEVEIWVPQASGGLGPQGHITTESDGRFFFELIPNGAFSIRAYSGTIGGLAWLDGTIQSAQVVDDLELVISGPANVNGVVAVCYGGGGEGETVSLDLRPSGFPSPFISTTTIDQLKTHGLQAALDQDGRTSFSFFDLALGQWNLRVTSASHGSAWHTVRLDEAGEIVSIPDDICLHPTGSISGKVFYPESGEGAPSVQVQVYRMGSTVQELLTAETTNDAGEYSFPDLPVNSFYLVRAYEALSNRGGSSGWNNLCDSNHPDFGASCFLNPTIDVDLAGLGSVEGLVLDGDGMVVANAYVTLRNSIIVNQNGQVVQTGSEVITFSSANGAFSFQGVAEGTIELRAFDPNSHLFIREILETVGGDNAVTAVDLVLPATSSVVVRVLDPMGQALDSEEPVVAFRQDGSRHFGEPSGGGSSVVHLSWDVAPSFAGVVEGSYRVAACLGVCEAETPDDILNQGFALDLGARANAVMPDPPSEQVVDLQLVARAGVKVLVTEAGAGIEGADVTVNGRGYYGSFQTQTQTGFDGLTSMIPNLGVGTYSIAATLPDGAGNYLRGAAEFEIIQEDHGVVLTIETLLEAAGAAQGSLLQSDGLPAVGALVRMRVPGGSGRIFQAISGADGSFVFAALPSSSGYTLDAFAAVGAGRHTLRGITVGSDVTDIGQLVLDEHDPAIGSILPANGSQGVDELTSIVIEFTELMRSETLTSALIRLRQEGAGSLVQRSMGIEDIVDPDGDYTRITLVPVTLLSDTSYIVDVLRGVEDRAGRTLAFDVYSSFRTRDITPPTVVSSAPGDDAPGHCPVGPDVIPVISFSEPVDPLSVTADSVWLSDANGFAVDAQLAVTRGDFDVRMTPSSGLMLDSFYTIHAINVTDPLGNLMVEPFASTFRVRDAEAPVVTLLLPDGASADGEIWRAVEGAQVVLKTSILSNDLIGAVLFSIDGIEIGSGSQIGGTGIWALNFTLAQQVGQMLLSVQAADVSGNISNLDSHVIDVVDDNPPSGTLALEPVVNILPNHILTVTVDAADDFGLSAIHLSLTGAIVVEQSVAVSGVSAQATRSYRVPVDTLAGEQVIVSCEIEDRLGQRTPLPPQAVTVLVDSTDPVVSVTEPQSGQVFISAETVNFIFAIEDDVTITSVNLNVAGDDVPLTLSSIEEPGTAWTAIATGSWLAAEPQTITWTLTLIDPAGNLTTLSDDITVEPLVNADAPVVSFICPVTGDHCAPDITQTVAFEMSDPNSGDLIKEYTVKIDGIGLPGYENIVVAQTALSSSFAWIPPSGAGPGQSFELAIEAVDYAGNLGTASITLTVPQGTILAGGAVLDGSQSGDIALAEGSYLVTAPLNLQSLILLPGVKLETDTLVPIDITSAGIVRVECGAAIDVTGRGYRKGQTYPDEIPPEAGSGGCHLGVGGVESNAPGVAFGSVTMPQEGGGGSPDGNTSGSGGGVIRIEAGSLSVEGSILANGYAGGNRGGAGGSVWLTVPGLLSGDGVIEANGGTSSNSGYSGGGGGAIAVEYGSSTGLILENREARGGNIARTDRRRGGAGTIYTFENGISVFGEMLADNNGAVSGQPTVLPALGAGEAVAGTEYATLVTDRLEAIQPYFVGHWVEVYDKDDAAQHLGTWQVESISADGLTVTLRENTDYPVLDLEPGDYWNGAYQFDTVTVRNGAKFESEDPVRILTAQFGSDEGVTILPTPVEVNGTVTFTGDVQAREIRADDMVVELGAVLTHPTTSNILEPESLQILVSGTVSVESGGSIDVTGRGYRKGQTYPDEIPPEAGSGGCHLGAGGVESNEPGSTFGSVIMPQEGGGGSPDGNSSGSGGGVIRIEAGSLSVEGSILANGHAAGDRGGAGGSVWLTVAGLLSGDGLIEANGGTSLNNGYSGGGGGAIAVEYGRSEGLIPGNCSAHGGSDRTDRRRGGAGTIFTFENGVSVFGDLLADNDGATGGQATVLPSLGAGEALTDTFGATLVTDRLVAIQPYFVGHWIEVYDKDDINVHLGTWQIDSISVDGLAVTLKENNDNPVLDLEPGDYWNGAYRFDSVIVQNGAELESVDHLDAPGWTLKRGWELVGENFDAPFIDAEGISVSIGSFPSSYSIALAPRAVVDPDGIRSIELSNGIEARLGTTRLFPGRAGERLTLTVLDGHPVVRRGAQLVLPPLPRHFETGLTVAIPENETPQYAVSSGNLVALADRSVLIVDWESGAVEREVEAADPVVGLAEGNEYLIIARQDALEVLDLQNLGAPRLVSGLPEGWKAKELVADDEEAVLLLESNTPDAESSYMLAGLPLGGVVDQLQLFEGLPFQVSGHCRIFMTRGLVHVVTAQQELEDESLSYTFSNASPGKNLVSAPEIWPIDGIPEQLVSWDNGLVAFAGTSLRMLAFGDNEGWFDLASLEFEVEILDVAVAADRMLVVLEDGKLMYFDLTDPDQPLLVATASGNPHRRAVVGETIVLFTPGNAASPVFLDGDPSMGADSGLLRPVPVINAGGR